MRWDYLFSKAVLQRGMEYYKTKRVSSVMKRGATYQATVIGNGRRYDVEVYLTDSIHPTLYCNCDYAASGLHCKHMAAVMCAIDDGFVERQEETAKLQEEQRHYRVYPFASDGESGEYRFFDLARMTTLLPFYEDTCRAAKEMIASGAVVAQSIEVGYLDHVSSQEQKGIFRGNFKRERFSYPLEMAFDRTAITVAKCNVPGCFCNYSTLRRYSYYSRDEQKLCVHLTALLFLLDQKLKDEQIGDATDSGAHLLLQEYRGIKAKRQAVDVLETSTVILEPQLVRELDNLFVSFKVGRDRMYVVKDLEELVVCVEERETLSLGTKASLDFSTAQFTERARSFYDFIWNVVTGEQNRRTYARESLRYRDDTSENIKARIPLYGKRLDDFFDLASGSRIVFSDRQSVSKGHFMIKFAEKNPRLELTLQKEEDDRGVFHGVRLTGAVPVLFEGQGYHYFFEEQAFYRIPKQQDRHLLALLAAAKGNRTLSMTIGRRYLSEFYYRVLPSVKEFAHVEEPDREVVEKYLPPEVTFAFLLDADAKNIYCRALAKYGEQECNLMDWRMGELRKEEFRDVQLESEALNVVEELFCRKDWERKQFHCGQDTDQIYAFLESGVGRLLELGEVKSTDAFRRLRIRRKVKLTVGVSVKSDIMDLQVTSEELSQEELLDILQSYQYRKKYYRLRNGDFLNLDEQNLRQLADMFEAMHITAREFVEGKMQLPLYRALYLDKMLEESEGLYTNRDQHFKQLVKNFKTVEDSDFEIPAKLLGVMRKYQKYGHRWLRTLEHFGFGGILADDMGLGKTLQVISVILAAASAHKERPDEAEYLPSLVVTPASLVYNWQEEFRRFAPEIRVLIVAGLQEERRELIKNYREYDVLITSYDLLKRDIAEYEDKEFLYQVIDEAQYIKNHTTAAAKSVKVIKSRVRYALTGTPIENRLSELWSIFDYLMPGYLYGYETFRRELEIPIAKNKEEQATARLRKMVSPFILRRLKSDVLKDLPEKLEEVCYAHMEEKQQQVYDGQVVHMQQMLAASDDEDFRKNKFLVLAELMKIRQICCDPALLFEDYRGESAKREACMELVHAAIEGEHKVLIFSQFTSMLELLEKDLRAEKISYYKIIGETPKERRVELVRAFNEDDTPIFLISLKAGGTGLNLTGADIVIHYDPWWNLAVQNQATDRAHRIGQTKVVSVYKLIVKDSIEEKILHMQEEKKNLADEILSGENGGIANLSREELLELLV